MTAPTVRRYVHALRRDVTITPAPGGRGKVTVTPDGGTPVEGKIKAVYDEDFAAYEIDAGDLGTIPLDDDEHDTLTRPKRARRTCAQCGGPLRKHGLEPTILDGEAYCHDCT
jgi:hypothetical protein